MPTIFDALRTWVSESSKGDFQLSQLVDGSGKALERQYERAFSYDNYAVEWGAQVPSDTEFRTAVHASSLQRFTILKRLEAAYYKTAGIKNSTPWFRLLTKKGEHGEPSGFYMHNVMTTGLDKTAISSRLGGGDFKDPNLWKGWPKHWYKPSIKLVGYNGGYSRVVYFAPSVVQHFQRMFTSGKDMNYKNASAGLVTKPGVYAEATIRRADGSWVTTWVPVASFKDSAKILGGSELGALAKSYVDRMQQESKQDLENAVQRAEQAAKQTPNNNKPIKPLQPPIKPSKQGPSFSSELVTTYPAYIENQMAARRRNNNKRQAMKPKAKVRMPASSASSRMQASGYENRPQPRPDRIVSAIRAETRENVAETAFLTQYVDPTRPVVGESTGFDKPTAHMVFKSLTEINLKPATAGATRGKQGDYYVNDKGNIGICVIPHIAPTDPSAVTPSATVPVSRTVEMVSGFVFDPDNIAMYDTPLYAPSAAGHTPAAPLAALDRTFLGAPSSLTPGVENAHFGVPTEFKYRTASLRATLLNRTNAYDTQGSVYCGDSGDFFEPRISQYFVNENGVAKLQEVSGDQIHEVHSAMKADNFSVVKASRIRPRGRLTAGGPAGPDGACCFEASFLPTCERAVMPVQHLPVGFVSDGTNIDKYVGGATPLDVEHNCMGTLLKNSPAVIFVIHGLKAGTTPSFELGMDWLVEVEAVLGTQTAHLLGEARCGPNYRINFGPYKTIQSGGILGAVKRSWAQKEEGRHGLAISAARRRRIGTPAANKGDGALPSGINLA